MNFEYSDRVKDLQGNAIREIFKALSVPGMISFAGGLPASNCIPTEEIIKSTERVLSSPEKIKILQYGETEGYLPLREAGLEYLKRAGIEGQSLENIIVLSGSQQTIDLLCKSLLNKGDVVLVEDPTYLACLHIIKTYEGKAVGVKTDDDGINLADLEEKIKLYKPKFLYLVPNFSNPKGSTLAIQKRKALAELSAKYNLPILEDDPYREFRYSGNALPAIKSFDKTGNVIYSVSFSKMIAPSLRVAIATGHKDIIRKMALGKQAADVYTNGTGQAVVHDFITSGTLDKVIANALPVYKTKFDKMKECLRAYMPPAFSVSPTEGGLFVWGTFYDGTDTRAVFKEAIENKVAYVCGSDFFAGGGHENTIRLNYTNATGEQIETGVKRLAEIFKRNK